MEAHFRAKYPKSPDDSDGVYKSVIRAKALDTLRGLLPAATTSNVGLFGTGQAFEALLLRMFAHPLEEVRGCAQQMLTELRQVIPAFLARVDQPDRGGRWIEYFAETRRALRRRRRAVRRRHHRRAARRGDADRLRSRRRDQGRRRGALQRVRAARRSAPRDRARACRPTIAPRCSAPTSATRANRRHKPGRAFERTSYRFDVLADYGAFRDLQRHRLLTLDWQPLSARHGYTEPAAIEEAGALDDWRAVMEQSAALYEQLIAAGLRDAAPVRRGDGLSRPLLHGHERARGDARHRAAHLAAGPSVVPPRLSADAPRDRGHGGTPRHRRRDAVRGSLERRARTAAVGAELEKKRLSRSAESASG